MNDNRCVCCGEQVPEGLMVCRKCEKKAEEAWMEAQFRSALDGTVPEEPQYRGVILQHGIEKEEWTGDLMAVVRWVEWQMQMEEYTGCEARVQMVEGV